jgi:hypothetical protein
MDAAMAGKITDALLGMAQANQYDFGADQSLCQSFAERIRTRGFKYVADKLTCGRLDCWSTYKELHARYPQPEKILADCEDLACAYAGWLAAQCFTGIYVGLVPGKRIAHAVAGLQVGNGKIRVSDPSIWYGMRETHYRDTVWRKLQ